jgi:predicted transcriptional regulator
MAIMYPIYGIWNDRIFEGDVLYLQNGVGQKGKHVRYRKEFEFRTRLPKDLKTGDKVYIYEPKKHYGAGKVVGEFTVGEIFKCDYPFGAFPFIVHFCRNVLKNEDYAKKFERAVKTELPGYKKGYILKYALDDESMDWIEKNRTPPDIITYLYDKDRTEKLDESEKVWKWCDSWLRKIGFYSEMGESNYKFAIEIQNPIRYSDPKSLSDFTKINGSVVDKAPQSFMYVNEISI